MSIAEKNLIIIELLHQYEKVVMTVYQKGQEANASLIRRLVKDKAVREKGNKCAICGKQYPNYVYDFHHLDPNEKDFNLGNKTSTVKWETVKKKLINVF